MTRRLSTILTATALVAATALAHADPVIVNLGVDVDGDDSGAPVFTQDGFFSGDDEGVVFAQSLTVPVTNPGAVFSPTLSSAELFVNAFDVGLGDEVQVSFIVDGQATILGLLEDNDDAQLPLEGGGRVVDPGDQDNTFFSITNPDLLSALTGSNPLAVRFDIVRTASKVGSARVDGINIQATALPEPSSVALLAVAFAGLAGCRRRRPS